MDRNARPLNEVVVNLLPTPRASDGEKGGPNQRGSEGDWMLPAAVVHLLPTPPAADSERESATYGRGNPTLRGAVSSPPSDGGSTQPADLPPGQLTIDVA
jgi:DNA (cytosine-5)-methyltransferase 1